MREAFQTKRDQIDMRTHCDVGTWSGSFCHKGHYWESWRNLNGINGAVWISGFQWLHYGDAGEWHCRKYTLKYLGAMGPIGHQTGNLSLNG